MMADLMHRVWDRAIDAHVPLSVHFDLTYRCNERCVHCYLDHDDHGEMTTARSEGRARPARRRRHVVPDVQRRRDPAAQGSLRAGRVRARAAVRRQAEDERRFSSAKRRPRASASSACARCRSASTPTGRRCTTRSRRFPDRSRASLAAIRFLSAHGVRVMIANVLMRQNASDYPGVRALAGRARRRVHDRPDDYAEDGWRYVDRRAAPAGAAAAPRLQGSDRSSATTSDRRRRRRSTRRRSTGARAAPVTRSATSRRTAMCTPASSSRCRAATSGSSGSSTSGTSRRSSSDVRSIRVRDLPTCSSCGHVSTCTRCPGLAYMEGNMRGPSSADCEKSQLRAGALPLDSGRAWRSI